MKTKKTSTGVNDGYSYPPGPFRLPVIGNLLGLKDGEKYLSSLVPEFGDVFTIYMGDIPVVVVNSTETARELMEDANLFNERAPAPVLNDYFKGRGTVFFIIMKVHFGFVVTGCFPKTYNNIDTMQNMYFFI